MYTEDKIVGVKG